MNENFSFAIAYDFNGTLSPGNMQEYSFIPALGFKDPRDFWALTKQCPDNTDQTLGYLFTMLKEARKRGVVGDIRVTVEEENRTSIDSKGLSIDLGTRFLGVAIGGAVL